MDEKNFEQIAEELREANEQLHIRIAKGWKAPTFMPNIVTTLQAKWHTLSYIEKVYTIGMFVVAGSILFGQIREALRKR